MLVLGIVLVLTAIPVFSLSYNPSQELEVDFLDVGQGDSVLIQSPYGQNIFDSLNNAKVVKYEIKVGLITS